MNLLGIKSGQKFILKSMGSPFDDEKYKDFKEMTITFGDKVFQIDGHKNVNGEFSVLGEKDMGEIVLVNKNMEYQIRICGLGSVRNCKMIAEFRRNTLKKKVLWKAVNNFLLEPPKE